MKCFLTRTQTCWR